MTKRGYYDLLIKSATDGTFPGYGYIESIQKSACMYRTPDGKHKCSVGILIPDEEYSSKMENLVVTTLLKDYPSAVNIPEGMTERETSWVQAVHDSLAGNNWSSQEFIKQIGELPCFKEFANTPS